RKKIDHRGLAYGAERKEEMVKEVYACQHCGAEADMTVEGFESVADVIKRDKKLLCKNCGKDVPWTDREDLKAIRVAIEAEKEAFQAYSKAAKRTKNPKGRDMFQQLSEFEMNHYQKLTGLLKSLQEKGEWVLYGGTSLKKKSIPLKMEKPKGHEQLTDMDALKIAIREEKKALAYYRSLAELTRDPRGKDMYKRLAGEESLHEKLLNDQYYSLQNTGLWSWGD
ncbi:MAG: ferritin family protein, partial [Thermodesulfobacteriota bacterium]